MGKARCQDFLLLALHILNSETDLFQVLGAPIESKNAAGGWKALVMADLLERFQQDRALEDERLQFVDTGLLARAIGGELADRGEPAAGFGQAGGVGDQSGLLVREEELPQSCFGRGDTGSSGFEARKYVVRVGHPAGVLHQFVGGLIDGGSDPD